MNLLLTIKPSRTLDNFCLQELLAMRRLSQSWKIYVDEYLTKAFDFQEHLVKCFGTQERAQEFRQLMSDTGALISGSQIVQFLDRKMWPSDIDVYVVKDKAETFVKAIFSFGYRYTPTDSRPFTCGTVLRTFSDLFGTEYYGTRKADEHLRMLITDEKQKSMLF